MVLASAPKHSNKQGKRKYTARKYYSICLKNFYKPNKRIAIGENKTKQNKTCKKKNNNKKK